MKVFGWAADNAGCGYYRMGLPLDQLGRVGHDTQVSTMLTGFERTADVIVGQRVCNPGASARWIEWARLPPAGRPKLVFEIDDDLFNIDPMNQPAFSYYGDKRRLDRLRQNAAAADLVTVTTEPLAEVFREINSNVVVLPNCIDEALLDMKRPAAPIGSHVVIGWAGSFNHARDWEELAPRLRRFAERRRFDVSVHFIGHNYAAPNTPNVRHTEWSNSVMDYYRNIDFDIGVAPLAPTVFNASKSDIKVLEYAALGIPAVASDVGPYSNSVVKTTGYLVSTPHEWDMYLNRFVEDPALRRMRGSDAHARARARTIQRNVHRWANAYEGISDAVL